MWIYLVDIPARLVDDKRRHERNDLKSEPFHWSNPESAA